MRQVKIELTQPCSAGLGPELDNSDIFSFLKFKNLSKGSKVKTQSGYVQLSWVSVG